MRSAEINESKLIYRLCRRFLKYEKRDMDVFSYQHLSRCILHNIFNDSMI